MGPSGCGKTTLLDRIFKKYDNVAYVPQEPPIQAFDFLNIESVSRCPFSSQTEKTTITTT